MLSDTTISLSTHAPADNIRLFYGPLPLEIKTKGHVLRFPPGVDAYAALRSAATGFWKALDREAPGMTIERP